MAGWPDSSEPRLQLGLETWARVLDTDPQLATATAPLQAFSPGFLSELGAPGIAQLFSGSSAPGTRQQINIALSVDIRAELPRITAPTLVVGCTLDYVVPVQNVVRLHQMIPASQYHTIESGHVVFHERPDDLVAAIRGFITQADAGNVA